MQPTDPTTEDTTTDAPVSSEETAAPQAFDTLGLDPKLVATIVDLGYEEPTPIQREGIPAILTGKDVIGQAATGTGKTAAFALPMLHRISEMGKERAHPSALILVPTRELAMQVAEAIHKYGTKIKLTAMPIYGGQSFGQQVRMLDRGVDVVVATPGRALDHIRRKTMDLSGIAILALDEADEMLDMGFADDLEAILSETPATRQTVLFSATLPPRIAGMVKRHLTDPITIQIAKPVVAEGEAPKVRQTAYITPRHRKLEVLGRVLDLESPRSALVFCRMRWEVDELTELLNSHGYRAQPLHGGITQDQRSRVIKRLREGAIDLVIATDVAARGLDIENLELVVNFDVPTSPESYVHRIGRVGRAGREGTAITLVDPRETRLLKVFERQVKGRIEVAQVPTVADLRARRLELLRANLREVLLAGNLDNYRVCVESLAQEHDLMDVALAAVKLAHRAAGGDVDGGDGAEEDEPFPVPREERGRDDRNRRDERPPRRDDRSGRPQADRPQRAERPEREERPQRAERPQREERPQRDERPPRADKPRREESPKKEHRKGQRREEIERATAAAPVQPMPESTGPAADDQVDRRAKIAAREAKKLAKKDGKRAEHPLRGDAPPPPAGDARPPRSLGVPTARIFVGSGRLAGIRPQDLVGAIANEGGIRGNQIGAIEISDKYSIVEVPADAIEHVLSNMKETSIHGTRLKMRRFIEKKA